MLSRNILVCFRGIVGKCPYLVRLTSLVLPNLRQRRVRLCQNCRDPVFYLLSALGSDQQVTYFDFAIEVIISAPHFCFSVTFRVAITCASTSFISPRMLLGALDNVHDLTSVLLSGETVRRIPCLMCVLSPLSPAHDILYPYRGNH